MHGRLAAQRQAAGVSWDVQAASLGVDPASPGGDGLRALIKLAARIPGGVFVPVGVHVASPVGDGGEG